MLITPISTGYCVYCKHRPRQLIGASHFATGIHVNSDHSVVLLWDPNLKVFFDRVRISMIFIMEQDIWVTYGIKNLRAELLFSFSCFFFIVSNQTINIEGKYQIIHTTPESCSRCKVNLLVKNNTRKLS